MLASLWIAAATAFEEPVSCRRRQREELQHQLALANGSTRLHEWGHYFVLLPAQHDALADEIERRVFEAREFLVRLFPESESDPVRDDRRLPVLRMLPSLTDYQAYGGSAGSLGYWSIVTGEIVVPLLPERAETWDSLAGCVTRAYLDELFGDARRARWFEEGLVDYVASSVPGCSRVREAWLQRASAQEIPTLAELLSGAQASKLPPSRMIVDPRVWSWTWMRFLCDEERRTPDFDPRWALIPERYAVGWITRGDEEKACAFAFEGLDRAALERAWLASVR